MATMSRFRVVRNYYDLELWRDSQYLGRFVNWDDMLQFVYDLDRYLPEETLQLPLEWD